MITLLDYPEIQSAVVPFIIALAAGAIIHKLKPGWGGIALTLAFLATGLLVSGGSLMPLTATNKMILITLIAGPVGLVLDQLVRNSRQRIGITILFLLAGLAWSLGKILFNLEGLSLWLTLGGSLFYLVILVLGLDHVRTRAVPLNCIVIALGTGVAVSAVLGSSALLGQLAGSEAAAAGALLLLAVFLHHNHAGSAITLSAISGAGMFGLGAMVLATLPWYTLVFFPLIPLAGWIPVKPETHKLKSAAMYFIPAMMIAGMAVLSVWLGMEKSDYAY